MKIQFFLLMLLSYTEVSAQLPIITVNPVKKDSSTFLNSLPVKSDFLLAYLEECYWWSNIENYKLLIFSNNQWASWIYYREWKSSADVYDNKGKKGKKNIFIKSRL